MLRHADRTVATYRDVLTAALVAVVAVNVVTAVLIEWTVRRKSQIRQTDTYLITAIRRKTV